MMAQYFPSPRNQYPIILFQGLDYQYVRQNYPGKWVALIFTPLSNSGNSHLLTLKFVQFGIQQGAIPLMVDMLGEM